MASFAPGQIVLVDPLSGDRDFVVADLALLTEPTAGNGCAKHCHALSHCGTTNSMSRITPPRSHIMPEQLDAIRWQIALAIGVE